MQFRTAAVGVLLSITCIAAGRQDTVDPALRAAVERFFAAQQAENVDAYLALWSASAARPSAAQLKFIFDAGDDRFSDVSIVRVTLAGDAVRVRVSATRDRTEYRGPARVPVPYHTRLLATLTFVRERDAWRLVREGTASDELADLLIDETDPSARNRMLDAEPEIVDDALLQSLARRGGAAAQTQAFSAAKTAYDRTVEVARRLGDRKSEAEALQNLGTACYFLGQLGPALEAYEHRLAIDRERNDDEGIAAALLGMATIRYSFADYGAALSHYREALAIQERTDDEAGIATTLISTGNIAFLQGDFEAAIAAYRRSRDLHRRMSNTMGEANALEGLGRTLAAQGDLAGALQAFAGVLEEGRARGSRPMQGNALASLGEVHFRLGNLDTARASFVDSRGHFDAGGDRSRVGRVWQQIALSDLARGAIATAEQEYAASAEICTAAADAECVAGAVVGRAFACSAQDKFTDAIPLYEKAIAMFAAAGHREPAARARIGLAQALTGAFQYEKAVDAATEARRAALALDQPDISWRALVEQARALSRGGDPGKALGVARAALYPIAQMHERADARLGPSVPRDTSAAFALLAWLQVQTGDAGGALETIERMRLHALRTVLAPAEREIARGMTDGERQEERARAAEVASISAQIARVKGLPRPDSARLETLERALEEATDRRDAHMQAVFERLPDLRLWRGLVESPGAEDLAPVLDASDAALLELVVDDEGLVAIAARKGMEGLDLRGQVVPITRKVLAERVAHLVEATTARDPDGWQRAADALVRLLPARVLEQLDGAARVTIVPHDLLWRVPFEALPIEGGALSKRAVVSYASSAALLLRVPEPGARHGSSTVVVAPEIPPETRAMVAQTAPGWRLPNPGRAEGFAGAALLDPADDDAGAHVWVTGTHADEPTVRDRLATADVAYLAMPARVNGASPLFSPALLARGAVEDRWDGVLEPREIANLDLSARVAVFTDGQLLAMRDAADDLGVVQWAWRAAGVPAIIVPRWVQDDGAAAALLAELDAQLRAGMSPADALARAQATVRGDARWTSPVYWAGWIVTGGR